MITIARVHLSTGPRHEAWSEAEQREWGLKCGVMAVIDGKPKKKKSVR